MTRDEKESEHRRFRELVTETRRQHRAIFAGDRSPGRIAACRELEAKLDKSIAWIETNRAGDRGLLAVAKLAKLMRHLHALFVKGDRSPVLVRQSRDAERRLDASIEDFARGDLLGQAKLTFGPTPVGEVLETYTRRKAKS